MSVKAITILESGLVEGVSCPGCGAPIRKNVGGLYLCTNRGCQWRSYTLEPPPQPEKEPELPIATKDLTSSRQYIRMLGKALGKSERHVHRLRKRLGDINIQQTNHCTSLVLYPGGGKQHIPLPPTTKGYRLVEPRRGIIEVGSNLKVKHRYLLLDVDPKLSGEPLMVESYL